MAHAIAPKNIIMFSVILAWIHKRISQKTKGQSKFPNSSICNAKPPYDGQEKQGSDFFALAALLIVVSWQKVYNLIHFMIQILAS